MGVIKLLKNTFSGLLSQLIIDNDKDWNTKSITNINNMEIEGEIKIQSDKIIVCDTYTGAGINACIDALGSEGGTVILPEGTYIISETITIDYSNTMLKGMGHGTILDSSASSIKTIICTSRNNIIFRDFQVKTNQSSGNYSIYCFNSLGEERENVLAENIYFSQSGNYAIYARYTNNFRVINCTFESPGSATIFNICNNCLIKGNNIIGNGTTGINLSQSQSGRIEGNYIEDSAIGIIINNSFNTLIDNNIIIDNNLIGVTMYGDETTSRNIIKGNIIYDCGAGTQSGIWIYSISSVIVIDNFIEYCSNGILIDRNENSSFINNTFKNCTTGILLDSDADNDVKYCIVSGNNFHSDVTTKVTDNGQNNTVIVEDSGKIGIGTDSPTEELDVNGDIKTDSIIFNSTNLTKRYTFDGVVEDSNISTCHYKTSAVSGDLDQNPITTWGGTELVVSSYMAISFSDDSNYNTSVPANQYGGLLFKFQIGEDADDISSLKVLYEGNHQSSVSMTFYIWNYNSSSWASIGSMSSSSDTEITNTYSSNLNYYIQNKTVYLLIRTTATTGTQKNLISDYIYVETVVTEEGTRNYEGYNKQYKIDTVSEEAFVVEDSTNAPNLLKVLTNNKAVQVNGNFYTDTLRAVNNNFRLDEDGLAFTCTYTDKAGISIEGYSVADGTSQPASTIIYGISFGIWSGFGTKGSANLSTKGIYCNGLMGFWGTLTLDEIYGLNCVGISPTRGGGLITVSANNVYGLFADSIPEASSSNKTITNVYTAYFANVYSDANHIITNEYIAYFENPDNTGSTNKYQVVLAGNGAGSGIWFNGVSNYARIYAGASSDLRLAIGASDRIQVNNTGIGFNGATPIARPDYTISNLNTDRTLDCDSTSTAELADIIGTLISDLISYGLLQ